ncbi:MAG TPA: hypothetical protein HA319_07465 [Nitrosopumilaceae archaeon]|nr:hypothetical protein [Nitrosopumilaceae archaeon]
MICREICVKYKAYRTLRGSRYTTGQKRCNLCNIFLKWDGLFCPCCNYKLRQRPRNRKFKEKFLRY